MLDLPVEQEEPELDMVAAFVSFPSRTGGAGFSMAMFGRIFCLRNHFSLELSLFCLLSGILFLNSSILFSSTMVFFVELQIPKVGSMQGVVLLVIFWGRLD